MGLCLFISERHFSTGNVCRLVRKRRRCYCQLVSLSQRAEQKRDDWSGKIIIMLYSTEVTQSSSALTCLTSHDAQPELSSACAGCRPIQCIGPTARASGSCDNGGLAVRRVRRALLADESWPHLGLPTAESLPSLVFALY